MNDTIIDINISHQEINSKHLKIIADGLKNNKTLISLSLNNIGLDHTSLKALTKGMIENNSLTTLNLTHNNLTYSTVKPLVELLKVSHFVLGHLLLHSYLHQVVKYKEFLQNFVH